MKDVVHILFSVTLAQQFHISKASQMTEILITKHFWVQCRTDGGPGSRNYNEMRDSILILFSLKLAQVFFAKTVTMFFLKRHRKIYKTSNISL